MDKDKKDLEKDLNKENEDAKRNDAPLDDNAETKEKVPLSELIDDTLDEVVARTQDFFYGEREDYNNDIPATIIDPDNEIRHINKVQTRRNFNKRYGKKFIKWIGIIMGIGIVVSLFYVVVEKLLLA